VRFRKPTETLAQAMQPTSLVPLKAWEMTLLYTTAAPLFVGYKTVE
jgi:hypothetical protein